MDKRYEEALERAKAGKPIDEVFPELKESDDERVRQEIHAYLFNTLHNTQQLTPRTNELERWIAYLEKQKDAIGAARQQGYEEGLEDGIKMNMAEQMGESKEWADELSAEIDRISKRYPEVSFAKLSRVAVHFVRWQKEQKPFSQEVFDIAKHEALWGEQPPAEWSEEDTQMLSDIDGLIWYHSDWPQHDIEVHSDWLKSLRPQPHWKPSEEQMETLKNCAYGAFQNGDGPVLRELYNDLKKL